MEDTTFKVKRSRSIRLLLSGCFGFLAMSIIVAVFVSVIFTKGEYSLEMVSAVLVVILSPISLMLFSERIASGIKILRGKAIFSVKKEGFLKDVGVLSIGFVPWNAVVSIDRVIVDSKNVIEVRLIDDYLFKKQKGFSGLYKFLIERARKLIKKRIIRIHIWAFEKDSDKAFDVMNNAWRASRGQL